jgi:hypothetical protein
MFIATELPFNGSLHEGAKVQLGHSKLYSRLKVCDVFCEINGYTLVP